MFKPEKDIKNAQKVIDFLGEWPSFHDSEVLKIEIDRDTLSLEMKLYTFLMLKEINEQGYYKLDKECVITFRFLSIEELELTDFNQQNVISRLDFEQSEGGNIKVIISPCYGLNGGFICKEIEVVSIESYRKQSKQSS